MTKVRHRAGAVSGVTDRQASETTTNQNLLARNSQAFSSSSSLVISFPALSSRPQTLSFGSYALSSVLKPCHSDAEGGGISFA
jgi:hypothetical protein